VLVSGCAVGAGGGGRGGGGNVNARNANENGTAQNANDNQNVNAVANENGQANQNSGGGPTIPEMFQGAWSFMGDCGAFEVEVDASGQLRMTSSFNCVSGDGTVQADGSFELTVACNLDSGGGTTVFCVSTLTGQLDPVGVSSGSGTRECLGDPMATPCAFSVSR
jgi:hypothetical protein